MKFTELDIQGVFFIDAEPYEDERGLFRRSFCTKEFQEKGINPSISQASFSENNFKGTLRGFHYQLDPHGEDKTISCIRGKIFDIIVDLRKDSKTYLKWISFEISAGERRNFHVPSGCANAFLTLEDNTLIHYYISKAYNPDFYRGIRYNDPLFSFKWPLDPSHISEQDLNWPDFINDIPEN